MSATLQGAELYFDCFAGIAGDMTLGALFDLGVPEEVVRAELQRLPLGGYRLTRERVRRGALVGTKIHVLIDEPAGAHDHAKEPHDHALGHAHGHAHEHAHEHSHDHAHGHDHAHEHGHSHDHGDHAHAHEHHHAHEHDHGRAHDPAHGSHDPRHAHEGAHAHAHRHYRDIKSMLVRHLDGDVLARALGIFDRIAIVEARLHGTTIDEVAFHEVGAVDSIVDIVGAAAALAWLRPSRVTSRVVPLGGGTVDTAHGRLPVPAPATLELLTGIPVEAGGDTELTTPTGAGIVAASATEFGPMPAMTVLGVGWGAGDRELHDRPNLLRVVAGRRAATGLLSDEVVVVEANIDDMNPELCEPLGEALFAAGAVDVWYTPIVMKKSRPALTVSALCPPAARDEVAAALLRESTSIGVRFYTAERRILPRDRKSVV